MWQSFVAIKNTCAGDMGKSPSTTAAENAGRRSHKGELRDEKGPPHASKGWRAEELDIRRLSLFMDAGLVRICLMHLVEKSQVCVL